MRTVADSDHLQEWVGLQVSAVASIDEHCHMDAVVVDGWLELNLRGECGDIRLHMTPGAVGRLVDELAEKHRELNADSGGGVSGHDIPQI
jgi:hypothetical protein